MFDPKAFYLSISSLLRNEQDQQAEQAMLAARAELTLTGDTFSFKHVQACQAQVNGDAQ